MEIAAAELARVLELYSHGLYLQAYQYASALAPLKDWEGTAARLLAGRLSRQLGAPRLSRWHLLKAYRGQPSHPEAIYYHARYHLEKHSLLQAWRFLKQEASVIDDASPELRADLFSLHAFIVARLRDFGRAEVWLQRALELTPDRPWIHVERAACLEFEERIDEALEAAREALRLKPFFRPAVQAAAHLLLILDRDDEALTLLTEANERIECAAVASQLAALQDDLGLHAEAKQSYDRFEALSPLMETETTQWLAARRSDIHYDLGELEAAARYAQQAGEGFHQTVAERLANPQIPHRRVVLERVERWPRPLPTVVPVALAILRRAWTPDEPPPSDEAFRQDAPMDFLERRWAEQGDWVVREFTATPASLHALLDAGVPIALGVVEATFAQLQAIAGYDEKKGILLYRDATERHLGEMMLDPLLERFRSSGPRGLVLLPPSEADRLKGIELPDADLYDRLYEIHRAMEISDRSAAGRILADMEAAAPDHRLVLYARYVLARYDANNAEQLATLDALLQRFPDDVTFLLQRINVLRDLDRREDRIALLRRLSQQPGSDPIFMQQYAQELLADAREHATAERLLRKVIRARPLTPAAYFFLANLLWDQQRQEEGLELYRIASCLDDGSDGLARTYFRSARAANRTDEAIQFFEDRVARFGDKSSLPARILFNALSDLDQTENAFGVLDRALARRKTDGELLLFTAEMRAAFGEMKTASALLIAARDKVRPTAWLRAAANLAGMQGNLHEALGHWREVAAVEPLALDAHRNIALRLAETESRAAALDYLKGLTDRNPRHYGLLQLRIEWLRHEGPAAVEPVVRQLLANYPADAWAHRELALHLADLKRYAEADEELRAAARLEPPSPSYHCVCGRVHTLAGRSEEARESYRAAIRLSVDNDLAISELLNLCPDRQQRRDELQFVEEELHKQPHVGDGILTFHGHAQHALEPYEIHRALQQLLDERSDLWQTWSAMIQQLIVMERLDEARTLAEQATERFPMLPRLWLDRADVHAARGDHEGQVSMLRQALKISPGWGPAIRELAEALDRDGKLEEACALLQQAVARAPLDPANRGQYADKLWKLNQPQLAVDQLREALLLDPGYDWAWRTLINWSERMDQPEMVPQFARELTTRRPGDPRVWLALARLLTNPANTDEVLAALDKVLTLSPRHSEARDLKAERLTELGRFDEAIAACEPAGGEPSSPLILQGRAAWIESQRGNFDAAIQKMEKIVEGEPDYYWGWQQLAYWYNEQAQSEKYLEATNHLLRLRPDSPVALAMRGEAQLQLGEREAGKADLRAALQMAPDYAFPGMLLFDEYFADEQYDQAAAVLAILQEHVADDFVAARQVQLAAKQDDKTTALDAFRNLCESPIEATWPISTALAALRSGGWSDEADEVLKESIQSRIFHPQAALLWLESPSAENLSFEDRLDVLERTLQKHPRFLPAHDRKAELLTRMEQFTDALAACKPKEFAGDPPIVLQGRAAWIEYTRGRRDKAIAQMEEIVRNSPDYFWGWQQLANWYDTTGRFEKYLQAAEEMVRIAPRDPTAFGYRGEAKLRLKDREGAKEDFRQAFELDPNYGFAGIHLLDQQIEDDELDDAAETLEVLRETGDDAHIRLRAMRLAIRRHSAVEASQLFEEFATDLETPLFVFRDAMQMLEEANWGAHVDDVIERTLDDEDANPLVGRFWVERCMARGNSDCARRIDALLDRGEIGEEALVAYIEALANARLVQPLFATIEKHRDELRADTGKWGKVGWAYARVGAFSRTAEWMSDWAEHADAQSWMLINLAIAYRADGRDEEARRVSQFALANAEPDATMPFHSVWLAFDDATAGRTADAARRVAQLEKDREQLDAYFKVVHAMAQALVKVQQNGSRAFNAARAELERTAQENQNLDPDPAIYRAWKKCVTRMARDAFSIRAWLWARSSSKNPPLPPPPSNPGR